MSADLSSLTIGALSLTPEFDSGVTAYAVSTSNATIQILNGETEIENGSSATWAVGENTLTVKVTNGSAEKTYTVTVTKS